MHVHACTHVCVLGSSPPTLPCKNGEHSESPKPQDPSRKSKALNIWSRGVTSPGTHLTEDGGRLTARWNVKVEVSPSQPFVCSPNIYGASFLAGWCWTPGQAGRQGDRLTEKIVGKRECVKCIPSTARRKSRATWGCSLGWKRVISSFMARCCVSFSHSPLSRQ